MGKTEKNEGSVLEVVRIGVQLDSLTDVMFDRFIDYSAEKRPPEQKLYLFGKNQLVLPQDNLTDGFLCGLDPKGCAITFEGKQGKDYRMMASAHVMIDEAVISFLKDDHPVVFTDFDEGGPFWIHRGSPRVKKGSSSIKQEMKERPVLRHPWALRFSISLVKNAMIDETKLFNWFMRGGMLIGIGTYRPKFGRFTVTGWEIKK
jgi:hypothetical protein